MEGLRKRFPEYRYAAQIVLVARSGRLKKTRSAPAMAQGQISAIPDVLHSVPYKQTKEKSLVLKFKIDEPGRKESLRTCIFNRVAMSMFR